MQIEWEDVSCMLCGSRDGFPAGSVEWRSNRLNYEICTGCGLKYMKPRPSQAWYRDFYEREFWEDKFDNRSWRAGVASHLPWKWLRGGLGGRLHKGRKRAKVVAPLIADHVSLKPQARVLDIGCAFGLILERLKLEHGCEPYGIEPSNVARDYATRHGGVKFIGTSAEDLPGLTGYDGYFDLVIISNVLENIVDPVPVLAAVRRLLRTGGMLYVETPNFFYYDSMNPYHPYIFSEETLSRLLAEAGLDPVISLYRNPVGAATPDGHVDRTTRKKFVTIIARPGDASRPVPGGVDVDRLLAMQHDSLAVLSR